MIVGDPKPAMTMVLRNDNVPRVANDVDRSRITGIKAVVALDDLGRSHPVEVSLCGAFGMMDQPMDIREGGGLMCVDQIGEKKPDPGVARFWNETRKTSSGRISKLRPGRRSLNPRSTPAIKCLIIFGCPPFAPTF